MKVNKLGKSIAAALAIPAILYAVFSILRPSVFLGSASTLYTILIQSVTTSILAWGLSFSLMVGDMDFSIVAEMILYEILATIIYTRWGFLPMLLLTVLLSVGIGLVKAFVKQLIGVQSMVIGLGITYIFASLGELVGKGRNTSVGGETARLAFFPYNVIILAVMGLITWYLSSRSTFGAHVSAISGDRALAKAAGISQVAVSVKISLYGSFCAGVASLYTLARGGGVKASHGLESMTQAFTSMMCFLIGIAIVKYVNLTIAIFVGAVSMSIIGVGLVSVGIDSELNNTIISSFLLVLIVFSSVNEIRERMKLRRAVADAKYEKAGLTVCGNEDGRNME